MIFTNSKITKSIIFSLLFLGLLSFFDKALAVGIIFCLFLLALAFWLFSKLNIKEKDILILFLIAFSIHLGLVLVQYYTHFQPFGSGSGDFVDYNLNAQEISRRLHQGDFSTEGLMRSSNDYPVFIGYIYALTIPNMLIGQLFNAWLAALIVILSYLIVIEIGGNKKGAFLVGLIVNFYPSLIFYGSLLLKDAAVVFLVLLGMLFVIKMIRKFSWKMFSIFYLVLACVTNLRFYLGYAVMFSFILSWFLFGSLQFKKRILYLLIIIPLFGFLPQFFAQEGYWGLKSLKTFVNPRTITYYREVVYAPPELVSIPQNTQPVGQEGELPSQPSPQPQGPGSSFVVKTGFGDNFTFLLNSSKSFIYSLLGPFPWQLKYKKHLFSLLETIPWYFFLFFIVKGISLRFRRNYKDFLPLIFFSLILLGTLAIFINNFGILTRIRIPAFIALLCLVPFGLEENSIIYKSLDKIYNRMFRYRWSR